MVLLDFVGEKDLSIPRESNSSIRLWAKLRAAAERADVADTFPPETRERRGSTTTSRSSPAGVPAIDLIDFDFDCWHRTCDDMSAVSEDSLDRVGETVMELLPRL